jgi:hypothetical protein
MPRDRGAQDADATVEKSPKRQRRVLMECEVGIAAQSYYTRRSLSEMEEPSQNSRRGQT